LFGVSGGVLSEGDQLSLSRGLRIDRDGLEDDAAGASHKLHPKAQQAIKLLAAGVPAERWLTRSHLSADEAAQILSFLNDIGGLSIKRSLLASARLALARLYSRTLGFRPAAHSRRFNPTLAGIATGTTFALAPLLMAIPTTGLLWLATGLPLGFVATTAMSATIALWLSVIAHEYAHRMPIAHHSQGTVLLQRGLHLGLLHSRLSARDNRISALSGPLAGAACALAIAPGPVGYLLAGFHLLSLTPLSGDGQALFNSLRKAPA
jgi:hypothetical protein